MANQNGLGANASNAGVYGGMNASMIPSAGHFSDMQALLQNMENLSGWLQQNREEWMQIQEGLARVERLQGRLSRDGEADAQQPQQQQSTRQSGDDAPEAEAQAAAPPESEDQPEPTTDLPPDPASSSQQDQQPTLISLELALSQANARIAALESTYRDQQQLQAAYEETLTEATERIRAYVFEQQTYVADLQRHYISLLQQSRFETVEAQLTHQAWQAGLQRVSEAMRMAVRGREEEGRPWRARIAALKSENRLLRQMVGWSEVVDEEEEDQEAYGDEMAGAGEEGRGRRSRAEAGGGGGGPFGQIHHGAGVAMENVAL